MHGIDGWDIDTTPLTTSIAYLATVKLSATPPALRDMRKTRTCIATKGSDQVMRVPFGSGKSQGR